MEKTEENIFVESIKKMHLKFGVTHKHVKWTPEEKDFRITAMQEELDEYIDAETKEDELDALLDLMIFTIGTAERQGLLDVYEEAFMRVMRANCNKEVGKNAKRGNFSVDLIKPEHWKAPVLLDLVNGENKQGELFEGATHGC